MCGGESVWKGNGALQRAPFEGVVLKRGAGTGLSKAGCKTTLTLIEKGLFER